MKNDIVVFSYRGEEIKSFIKNFLPSNLNKACIVEADHLIKNPGIIERLEWEHNQGKNIILVENGIKKEIFTEEFFRQERVFWIKNLFCLKKVLRIA